MEPVAYVLIGLMAGWLAHLFLGSRGGLLSNIAAGIIGAFVTVFVLAKVALPGLPDFSGYLAKAALGAVVFLVIWRSFFKA